MAHRFLAAAVAGVAAVTPVAAQEQGDSAAEARLDLECALLFAAASETVAGDQQKGMQFAMAYFIGRFEGATALKFDEFATPEMVEEVSTRFAELGPSCGPMALDIGTRMQVWGEAIQEYGMQAEAAKE